jgi:hypothetical protein
MDRGIIMTEEECSTILQWIKKEQTKFIDIGDNRFHHIIVPNQSDIIVPPNAPTDFVSTFKINQKLPAYNPSLPTCIWDIKKTIIEKEGLQKYIPEPYFQDFIYICPSGTMIPRHRDPNLGDLIHCRFNVFLELPKKGGDTYYNGVLVDSKERSYVLSKSGLEWHWSSRIEEGTRISISYGFLIPKERVDTMISFNPSSERIEFDPSRFTMYPKSIPSETVHVKTHFEVFKDLKK